MAQVLITGGAGFIGSHTCLVLLEAKHDLIVLDNFSNSSPDSLARVLELAGLEGETKRLKIIGGDIRNRADVSKAFETGRQVDAVIHFAGLKSVGESVLRPLHYWDVNVCGSACLLSVMQEHGCRTIAFSSSATLYGIPEKVPIDENAQIKPINPYGFTKATVEQMLEDLSKSEPGWRIARLRYFNPVGAHPSGRIGEDPNGIPNNLFPFVSQVAVKRLPELKIFGGDWPTVDGTGVRDYIHVMDLAYGHLASLQHLLANNSQIVTLNLGSGKGHSVLSVVKAFEKASGSRIPYKITNRRDGDASTTVASPKRANDLLGWTTTRDLNDMCIDAWNWQKRNPYGYLSSQTSSFGRIN